MIEAKLKQVRAAMNQGSNTWYDERPIRIPFAQEAGTGDEDFLINCMLCRNAKKAKGKHWTQGHEQESGHIEAVKCYVNCLETNDVLDNADGKTMSLIMPCKECPWIMLVKKTSYALNDTPCWTQVCILCSPDT